MDKLLTEQECLGRAEVVIAGGGITGAVAAGELALRGVEVLLVQSRNTLLHEIVRAQLPLGQWGQGAGSFRLELLRRASLLEGGRGQSPLPFSLELVAEQFLSERGVRILYEGFPFACEQGIEPRGGAAVSVACRGRAGRVLASGCVLDCSDRAVLLRAAGAAHEPVSPSPTRLVLKLVGLGEASAARIGVKTARGDLTVAVPPPDERGWALAQIRVPAGCPGWDEVEPAMAAVCADVLEAVRAFSPAYAEAALAFIGDEYYRRPPFRLLTTSAGSQMVSLADGALRGGGSWSLGSEAPPEGDYPNEACELAAVGEQLAEAVCKAMAANLSVTQQA